MKNIDVNKSLNSITEEAPTPAQFILNQLTDKEELPSDGILKSGQDIDLERLRTQSAKAKRQQALRMTLLATEAEAPAAQPVDVSSAVAVETGKIYNLSGLDAGKQLLLKLDTKGIAKLSTIVQFDASTVFETAIFTVDEKNIPTMAIDDINRLSNFNIVSCLPHGGTYYIFIVAYAGGGNSSFALLPSPSYSANEPNDAPSQAPLRHEEVFLYDTFDNAYDTDFVRLQVTNPEPVAISFGFMNSDIKGRINLGIYHKTDENGKPVEKWLVNKQMDVPDFNREWQTVKGELYVYAQYVSGDCLYQPYVLSIIPASRLPNITYISTGQRGVRGVQDGYIDGTHWVMGAFEVIADFRQSITPNADGVYPCFPVQLILEGKGQQNSTSGDITMTSPDGLAKLSALLPYSYGEDSFFDGRYYTHTYDKNNAYVLTPFYDAAENNFGLRLNCRVSAFNPFYNVKE